ncbi:MAG: NAD(P)/FAD-dependent oxidoreductase, partial [Lachnospiraceae bacterium]|nr:NAD(P)/FAD-dependent oxidoreductase [Lachnospiraceae bacterium]
LTGLINRKLLNLALRMSNNSNLKADSEELKLKVLAGLLKNFEIEISGTYGYENAQVTTGGLSLDDIDHDTMEAKFCSGLYVVGETLDVDGICGGYNLQWAWTTGAVAGGSAALGTFDKKRILGE